MTTVSFFLGGEKEAIYRIAKKLPASQLLK
jgi:hypothetical protein